MQETFIVTVQTEDGKCLIQKKIIGIYSDSLSLLSQLFHLLSQVREDSYASGIGPGSGTGRSVSEPSLPTES